MDLASRANKLKLVPGKWSRESEVGQNNIDDIPQCVRFGL